MWCMRTSNLPRRNGEPFGTTRISAPLSAIASATSGYQLSSQIGVPKRSAPTRNGPAIAPGRKTRGSSKTL